mgnify:CR=1 FL=1
MANRFPTPASLLHPRLAVVAHDLVMVWLAWFAANWIRFHLLPHPPEVPLFAPELPIVLAAQGAVLYWTGLYRGLWRFASLPDLWNIARAGIVGALFIALGLFLGYDTRYIPLHVYFNRALDAMWAHLKQGAPLPPSQVVRTVPRGGVSGAAPALTAANVPPIQAAPGAGDLIGFSGNTLSIPD